MTLTRPAVRTRYAVPLAVLAVALTACSGDPSTVAVPPTASPTQDSSSAGAPSARPAASVAPSGAGPSVLVSGLEAPWGLAFLPGGDALVSERDSARVLRVPAAGGAPVEVTTVEQARPAGEGGLLGLAVSPSFATDDLVFAYVTTEEDNRIVGFPLSSPQDVEPVLTGIPKGRIHNGGRLAFGPDGLLYAGTGDTGDTDLSQDEGSLGGKVLRMTLDGDPAEAAGSLVFSKGHRNVQGLAFDDRGRLFATEFGQNRFDEVNLLTDGGNYGWPEVEGAGTGGGRYTAPLVTWETSQASPSGAAIVGDSLYVAALRGERLWQVPLAGGDPTPLLQGEYGRLRAAAAAPDGSLWVLTSNRDGRGDPVDADDRLLRLALQ
ncbi:MAG: glucose sorbosone dehydrogenase [Frankiales bacterium]|nr:glucose sorbosone dehydrogenase [Frankiales bacterium]